MHPLRSANFAPARPHPHVCQTVGVQPAPGIRLEAAQQQLQHRQLPGQCALPPGCPTVGPLRRRPACCAASQSSPQPYRGRRGLPGWGVPQEKRGPPTWIELSTDPRELTTQGNGALGTWLWTKIRPKKWPFSGLLLRELQTTGGKVQQEKMRWS